MKKLSWILLLGSLSLSTWAQNFEQYYQQAAENHPALRAIFNEYYGIMQQQKQVNKLPPPEWAFGVFVLPVETRLGAQRLRTGISQMFPPIGQLKAKSELVDKKAAVKLQEASIKRNEIYFELQAHWYELLEIAQLLQVDSQQLRRLDVYEKIALQKIEVAKGSSSDIYRIEMKRNDLTNQMAQRQNKVAALEYAFQTLLNAPDSSALEIILPDSIAVRALPYAKDSLKQWITREHPKLQLLELRKAMLKQKKQVRKTQNRPSFGVGIDYVWLTKRTDADPRFNGRDVLMPKASIKIPIYKSQNQARLKEVEYEKLALNDWQEDLEHLLLLQLEKTLTSYRAAQLDLAYYQKQEQLIRKTTDLLIEEFSVGKTAFEEVLRMDEQLFGYSRKRIKAAIKQNKAIAMIERLFAAPL